MIEVRKISAEKTYSIRLEVLRKNIPLPYQFNGDFDEDTFHLGAFKENKLIAVSSYMAANNSAFNGKQVQLRGMATLASFQGLGAGKLMLLKAVDILKAERIFCLWCNARLKAVKFYKKNDFETVGDIFQIKHVGPHYLMLNRLVYDV